MLTYQGTKQVAAEIGVRPTTLLRAVWDGRIPPPPKNSAGDFCWRRIDVCRAAKVFGRRLGNVARPSGGRAGAPRPAGVQSGQTACAGAG
jgi:hypothetical protein